MAIQNVINKKSADLTIDPGAAGDSYVQFDINTVGKFRIGVDDSDGDAFIISQGSALGTNNRFKMTANGERTIPLQPCFYTYRNTTIYNVTGNGTEYTVVFTTEIFDQNADFDGTSTFTAPVDGKYLLTAVITYSSGLTLAHTAHVLKIDTTQNTYTGAICGNGEFAFNVNYYISTKLAVIADMDASDTAVIKVTWSNGANTVNIRGSGTPETWFCGELLC